MLDLWGVFPIEDGDILAICQFTMRGLEVENPSHFGSMELLDPSTADL